MNKIIPAFKNATLSVVIGLILLSIIAYFNGTHGVYLFDFSIVHNYAYLLSKGYVPFRDFITPLPPLTGLIQLLGYKLFGMNYLSGVYTALALTIFQFLISFYILTKFKVSGFERLAYAFLLSLCCLPFVGTLYYNHLLLMLLSLYFLISIYNYQSFLLPQAVRNYLPFEINKTVICQYLLIGVIFLIKIQTGAYLLIATCIFDLFVAYKISKRASFTLIKTVVIRGFIFILPVAVCLFFSHSDIESYLNYLKHISLIHNIAVPRLRNLFEVPINLESGLLITPGWLYLIYVFFAYHNLKNIRDINLIFKFLLISHIYLTSVVLSLNSMEMVSSWVSFIILLILCFDLFHTNNEHGSLYKAIIRPSFFIIIFIFSFFYSVYSMRKVENEKDLSYPYVSFKFQNKLLFNENAPKLQSFFKNIRVDKSQYSNFLFLDSVLNKTSDKKVFFGPGLEMFNVVYQTLPPKGWPVWVHPGLTVTNIDMHNMELLIKNSHYDVLCFSKERLMFLPFMSNYLRQYYVLVPNESSWIKIYKRKDQI